MRQDQRHQPPQPKKRKKGDPYNGEADAERILERVLRRTRYNASLRDELASALRGIVGRELEAAKVAKFAHLYGGDDAQAKTV